MKHHNADAAGCHGTPNVPRYRPNDCYTTGCAQRPRSHTHDVTMMRLLQKHKSSAAVVSGIASMSGRKAYRCTSSRRPDD